MNTSQSRLFIALWPDDTVRQALAALPVTAGQTTRPGNLHLTLAFLGEQNPRLVEPLLALLRGLAAPAGPMDIDTLGRFGKRGDYTLWAGPRTNPDWLMTMHAELIVGLSALEVSFPREHRLTAHITLARHAPLSWGADQAPPSIRWTTNKPVLVVSQSARSGVVYRLLD